MSFWITFYWLENLAFDFSLNEVFIKTHVLRLTLHAEENIQVKFEMFYVLSGILLLEIALYDFSIIDTFWWYFSLSVAHQQQQINKLLIRYHLDSTKIFAKHMYIVTWSIIGQSSNTEDYFRFRWSTEQVWRALRQSTSLIFNILQLSSRLLV
jgi:hypothetical protein